MNMQPLILDQLEFSKIHIDTLSDIEFKVGTFFPKILYDFKECTLLTKTNLSYDDNDASDPRAFVLRYGIKISKSSQKEGVFIPYEVEVEAVAYLRYTASENPLVGAERFRAIRFSGYQMLHGAIREMISSLTARYRHGMWLLPARSLHSQAAKQANEDEEGRQAILEGAKVAVKKKLSTKKVGAAKKAKKGEES